LPLTILQRYVLRETLRVTFISLLALTGIIFVGVSVEMVREGLSVVQLRSVLPFLVAYSLPFAMPASFLVGSVFAFGRLSGQNELSAMRASGVGLHHVVYPLLLVVLLVCLGTFWMNHYLFPWSLGHVRNLTRSLVRRAIRYVGHSYTKYEQDDLLIYVGGLTPDKKFWRNVALIQFAHDYPARVLLAERGHCRLDEENSVAIISLYDGKAFQPQLGERIGNPVMAFDGMRYRVSLGAKTNVPTVGLAAREIRLIKDCVARAVEEAGLLNVRRELGRYLLFAREGPDDLSWRRAGVVEFDEQGVPTRVLTAATARLLPATADGPERLELRDGRELPVRRGKLREGEAVPFAELTLETAADAPLTPPAEGTRPDKLWFETRPKYLALPDLIDARRALRRAADELRKDPRYRKVAHPRSRRLTIEKEEARLHAELAALRMRIEPFRKAADDARRALEKTNEALRSAAERLEALERRLAQVERSRQEASARSDQLRSDLQRLAAAGEAAERLARLKASLGESERKERSLSAQAKKLTEEVDEQRAKCEALESRREEDRRAADAASDRLRDAERAAAEARQRYEATRRRVRDLKVIEKHLRADAEFHFRNAGAATSLIFVIIGIPLGILSRRGNVIMAFAISFFTVIILYYPLLIVGETLARDGFLAPWIGEWMPNIAIGAAGVVLFHRALRG